MIRMCYLLLSMSFILGDVVITTMPALCVQQTSSKRL